MGPGSNFMDLDSIRIRIRIQLTTLFFHTLPWAPLKYNIKSSMKTRLDIISGAQGTVRKRVINSTI